MKVLLFDNVRLTKNGEHVALSADEFLRLPLPARTLHLMRREVEFLQGEQVIDQEQALASLRALSAQLDKPKILVLGDDPGLPVAVESLERNGHQVLVVTLLTELLQAVQRFGPAVVVIDPRTAVLDEVAIRSLVSSTSRRIVLLFSDEPREGCIPRAPERFVDAVENAMRSARV